MADMTVRVAVAERIQRTIPGALQMALGMRDRILLECGLRFTVRGRSTMVVDVNLDRAADLYDVRVFRKAPRLAFPLVAEFHQVDGAALVGVLRQIDGGTL